MPVIPWEPWYAALEREGDIERRVGCCSEYVACWERHCRHRVSGRRFVEVEHFNRAESVWYLTDAQGGRVRVPDVFRLEPEWARTSQRTS